MVHTQRDRLPCPMDYERNAGRCVVEMMRKCARTAYLCTVACSYSIFTPIAVTSVTQQIFAPVSMPKRVEQRYEATVRVQLSHGVCTACARVWVLLPRTRSGAPPSGSRLTKTAQSARPPRIPHHPVPRPVAQGDIFDKLFSHRQQDLFPSQCRGS